MPAQYIRIESFHIICTNLLAILRYTFKCSIYYPGKQTEAILKINQIFQEKNAFGRGMLSAEVFLQKMQVEEGPVRK